MSATTDPTPELVARRMLAAGIATLIVHIDGVEYRLSLDYVRPCPCRCTGRRHACARFAGLPVTRRED